MKKMIAFLLALTMLCLAGCGAKKDFQQTLLAKDFDPTFAPHVILEQMDGIQNLGGWTEEDDVWWRIKIPADGPYTFRFLYSMPGEFLPARGWVSMMPDEGDHISGTLEFTPTSEEGSWKTYGTVQITLELPKGEYDLSLSPYELPKGQDNFINLRQIDVFSGTPEASAPTGETASQPAVSAGVAGWWVTPEYAQDEGLRLVETFLVDEDQTSWTAYNEFGEPGDTRACTLKGNIFSMDLGYDMVPFRVDGDRLVSDEDGSVQFIHVADPGFKGKDLNFDGKWYLGGDTESRYYEISGKSFQRLVPLSGQTMADQEGTFQIGNVRQFMDGKDLGEVMKLTTEDFGPTLIPNSDMTILFEENGMEYSLYVRESALDASMTPACTLMSDMMEMDLRSEADDGQTVNILRFTPYCFYISSYQRDGEGGLSDTGEKVFGQWSLTDSETLSLMYEDGTTENIAMPEPEGLLVLDHMDCEFQLHPVF